MDKIKIGHLRINLNLVYEIAEHSHDTIIIRYTGDYTQLGGDEAKLFLMAWDGEDGEEFDKLYAKVNAPKPANYGEYGGDVDLDDLNYPAEAM